MNRHALETLPVCVCPQWYQLTVELVHTFVTYIHNLGMRALYISHVILFNKDFIIATLLVTIIILMVKIYHIEQERLRVVVHNLKNAEELPTILSSSSNSVIPNEVEPVAVVATTAVHEHSVYMVNKARMAMFAHSGLNTAGMTKREICKRANVQWNALTNTEQNEWVRKVRKTTRNNTL